MIQELQYWIIILALMILLWRYYNPSGEISSTVFDWFLITADADAVPGNIQCTVTMTAGTDEYPYQEQETINLDLTLSQFGFPLDGSKIDLNSDGMKEIDNEALHEFIW